MASCDEGRSALLSIVNSAIQDSENQIKHETNTTYASEWKDHPPLLYCWTFLLKSIESKDVPAAHVAAAIDTLASGALRFCLDGER